MIERYSRPDMVALWSAESLFKIWFEIEAHALDAMAAIGTVPQSAAKAVWDWWATNPVIDVEAGGLEGAGPDIWANAGDARAIMLAAARIYFIDNLQIF